MPFTVVRYDILSMAEDPKNPGHAVSYRELDPSIEPPIPMGTAIYDTFPEAKNEADRMKAADTSEQVDITLANGKKYIGPRYIYNVGMC